MAIKQKKDVGTGLDSRPCLVSIIFADLPSLHTLHFIEMIFILVHLYIEGRCVSLQKAQRKRRHDYPDAEVARRDRAAQSSQATKNCRGSETAEARERRSTRDRDRRKRRLDSESATHDACIAENVSSYIS